MRLVSSISLCLLAAIVRPGEAEADLLLKQCQNTAIFEDFWGVMACPVQNTGPHDVQVTGSFAIAVPIGPDPSDEVIAILGIGDQNPIIDAGQTYTFGYALFTPPEVDFGDIGMSLIEPIYSAEDNCTINAGSANATTVDGCKHNFVGGSYTGGVAAVLDADMGGDVPNWPPPPPPPGTISTHEDYTNFEQQYKSLAGDRSSGTAGLTSHLDPTLAMESYDSVNAAPEPAAVVLAGIGLTGLALVRRRKSRLRRVRQSNAD